jgi:hypothetical protein
MSDQIEVPQPEVTTQPARVKGQVDVKPCGECGKEFQPNSPANKFCAECRIKKERSRAKEGMQKTRDKQKIKKEREFELPGCKIEVTKKAEALEILSKRGVLNQQLATTLFELAQTAAQQHHLPLNHHLLRYGLQETLSAVKDKKYQPTEVEDGPVTGELVSAKSLHSIWDLSISWREDAVSFPEFLRVRHLCKTDAYQLGLLLGKDFEECQKNWAEFLPRFNPDALPANYTQKEMRLWLDSTCDVKDYLMLCSRNSMKSSFILVWLLTLHLCAPDARALLVSETQKLSAGFIRSYRSYWEKKPHQETVLTKFFPEFCIPVGTGTARSFESPMSHLDLIASSAESTSAESVVAGNRADVLINDDIISNLSCGTEEQRLKSVNTFDLLQKLREVLGSFSITIGTPWFADEDLYAVLLKRNEEEGSNSLAFRIDPVVTLKPEARHKLTPRLLPSLVQEDVESYLLPVRMPWRFVKKEISANPTFALSQNFCIFPQDADADIKVQFTEAELRSRFRPSSFYEGVASRVVCALDRAWSTQRYADYSCLAVGKITAVEGRPAVVIADVMLDRLRESELAVAIAKMFEKHNPSIFIAEKDRGYQDLWDKVMEACRLRSIIIPHAYWIDIDNTPRSAAKRAKRLELPISDGRLWFTTSPQMDEIIREFTHYDGIRKSSSTVKDDAISAIGLLWQVAGVRIQSEADEVTQEERQAREQQLEDEARREREAHYRQRMFGSGVPLSQIGSAPPAPIYRLSDWRKGGNPNAEPEPEAIPEPPSPMAEMQRRLLPGFPNGRRFKFGRR